MAAITIWRAAPSRARYPLVTIEPFGADAYGDEKFCVTFGLQRTGRTNQSFYWYRDQVAELIDRHQKGGNRIEGDLA